MDFIRSDGITHGLTRGGVGGSGVFIKLVAAGDHFIATREIFCGSGDLIVISAIGFVIIFLEHLPIDLDFIGFAVFPVFVIGVGWIVGQEIAQFHLVIIMGTGANFLHPHRLAKFEGFRDWRRWRCNHRLHLGWCEIAKIHRRIVSKCGCRDLYGTAMDEVARAVVDQPIV